MVVEKWNRNGGTVELLMVEQETEMVKRGTSDGGTDSGTVEHLMVEQ